MGVSLCQIPVNTTAESCQHLETTLYLISFALFFVAVAILIVLSFTQKRARLGHGCCQGYFGLVIPINLLNTSRHRIIYMLIFATLSNTFYNALKGNFNIIHVSDPYSQAILSIVTKLLYVLLLCIIFFPAFACVDPPIPIVGHVLGAIYEAFLLVFYSLTYYSQYTGCASGCQVDGGLFAIQVMQHAPILLICLFLLLWFIGNIFRDIYIILSKSRRNNSTTADIKAHYARVRHLLKRPNAVSGNKLNKILQKLYPYDPGFEFPLRFLSTMIISIVIVYQIALNVIFLGIRVSVASFELRKPINEFGETIINSSLDLPLSNSTIRGIAQGVGGTVIELSLLIPVCAIISTLFSAIQIFLMFRNVSDNLHQIARGDLSFLPKKLPEMKSSLLSSLKYPGYQVAYIFWGWLIYAILSAIVLIVISIVVVLLIYFTSLILPNIVTIAIGLIWTQILYWSQFFIVKYIFLEKAYPDSQHFVMNNRRFYHWFTYVFLLQNAIVGIFSTILRMITALAVGLLLFIRLDKVLLMKGFEYFDKAHKTYIGFIYLDYTYNNSVLNVFCHILRRENEHNQCVEMVETQHLLDSTRQNKTLNRYLLINDDVHNDDTSTVNKSSIRPLVSQRAYNRWRVAYTLIRNEQLLEFTAANLKATSKKQSFVQRLQQSGENEEINEL